MAADYLGPRSAGSGQYRPLQFDDDLMRRIGAGRGSRPRRRRSFRLLRSLTGAALVAATILGGSWAWSRVPSDDRALASMAQSVFEGLLPETASAPHTEQAGLLSRFFGDGKALAQTDGEAANIPALTFNQPLVEKIRADLQAAGMDWAEAKPLAFGGVRARLSEPDASPEGVTAVTGNVYFSAGNHLYALEISAERDGDRYIAMDIWQCNPVQAVPQQPEALAAHAKAAYDAFMREDADDGSQPRIVESVPVFVTLG